MAAAADGGAQCDPWREEERLAAVNDLQGLSLTALRHAEYSTRTVLAEVAGPLCSLSMFFTTEAHDNKGLPHCLEHLCFMGSQSYKRGYLDLLATRCGSDGTNAYTCPDHTCFSFEAVGQEGLLSVLPVFVDHVLCPLLTEDAFLTEVHHVNGKGERQGVVYSEMLGRVTDESEMLELERRRATFGDASPYGYEYGGMPEDILKLTRDDVAGYHGRVYTTDNLCVVVCGAFDQARLLRVLHDALTAAVAQGAGRRCQQRPFLSALPAPPASCQLRRSVQFPSDDVSVGSVSYSRRLDGIAFDSAREVAALDCLGRYLTDLASSPMEQAFVQCEPPIASGITCDVNLTADPHICIELTGVPFRASDEEDAAADKLGGDEGDGDEDDDEEGDEDDKSESKSDNDDPNEEEAEDGSNEEADGDETDWFSGDVLLQRLIDELRKVHDALKSGDEQVLAEVRRAVKKERISRQESFEDGPSEFLCEALCPHLIFDFYPGSPAASRVRGDDASSNILQALSARTAAFESLAAEDSSWWAELLERHLLKPLELTLRNEPGGAAEVRACPSAVLAQKNERREEKAAKQNAKKLGAKRLKSLQDRVDKAEKANEINLGEKHRRSFPSPATPDSAPDLPWSMELIAAPDGGIEVLEVEVPSGFVELRVSWLLDEVALSGRRGAELRRYIPLFAELLCETDVAGENYRTVVARLDAELVSYSAVIGRGSDFLNVGSHPHWFTLQLSAEPDRSADLVSWADRLAHECDFSEEKVLASCRRMSSDLKENMRQGEAVLGQAVPCAVHDALSPHVQLGALSQKRFLERCCGDVASACRALRELRDALTAPRTAAAAVVSGSTAERRGAVVEPLQRAWLARHAAARPALLRPARWGAGARPGAAPLLPLRRFVVGCAGADTAHLQLRAALPEPSPALDGKKSWSLRLLCEALSMLEGPLSMMIRGKGLAYGASVGFSQYDNVVTLDLWECTNVRSGVENALAVIRGALKDDCLTAFQLDNARGSLAFQIKGKRATPTGIVSAAVTAASRGWHSAGEVRDWEGQLASVTQDDVANAHKEFLMRLCDPSQVIACLVCDPGDCKQKAKGLATALQVDPSSVRVKEKLSECYKIVDDLIGVACGKLPE